MARTLTPRTCHFWNVALRLTARGLATPVLRHDAHSFDVQLDFVDDILSIRLSDGARRELPLDERAVAEDVMTALASLGIRIPANPPAGTIEHEAFSHAVSEAGFWPGDARYDQPAFYAMHAPAPPGYPRARLSQEARLGARR